jgi:hypothetical protein
MSVEEAGEDSVAEEAHQEGRVPFWEGLERTVRGEAAVGGEQVEMGVPLEEVPGGGDGDDEAGTGIGRNGTANELDRGLGAGTGQLGQEIAATAKERPQQAGNGQHHVAVRDELIGRLDPKTHREARRLEVKAVHFEPWFSKGERPPAASWGAVDRDAALAGVVEALQSLAAFLGAGEVAIGRVTPPSFARTLRRPNER